MDGSGIVKQLPHNEKDMEIIRYEDLYYVHTVKTPSGGNRRGKNSPRVSTSM